MNPEFIEISELNSNFGDNNDVYDISSYPKSSSNFGSGIELLMNDKNKKSSSGSGSKDFNIDVEDLDKLESELNTLSDNNQSSHDPIITNSFFNSKKIRTDDPSPNLNVHFDERSNTGIGIGKSTSQTNTEEKTWDGFSKFNEIPINIDAQSTSQQPTMTKEELLREKLKYLRKLESLEKKGVELTKKYTMDDSLLEMQCEYEMIMDEKSKQNSVKFQGNMLMACINGIEFLNSRFDPFDIKLDGWGEQLNENINDYDDIFGELHDKYKSKASLAPELKLLFQLGGSAMMVHMTNTLFKTSMPGMDDILRQNPDLMKSFQSAAMNSMGQSNPGFSGFMSNMANTDSHFNQGQGPPAPINTQGPNSIPPPMNRPGNSSNNPFYKQQQQQQQQDGISISENKNANKSGRTNRPEMNGPTDIDGILAGLKTKKINIQESPTTSNPQTAENSTISINDLKDLQTNGKIPSKSKRKPRSNKNTISLDI